LSRGGDGKRSGLLAIIAAVSNLEKEHPGIVKVKRSKQGCIILEETNYNLDSLINEINIEIGLFESVQARL